MRVSRLAQTVLFSLASRTAVAENATNFDPSLNFHPNNVTESALYYWVGSYFNGTTTVEVTPFSGLSANDHENFNQSGCPELREKTFSADFNTILAVTERGEYNLGNNPVNAYLTFWPSNINVTALPLDEQVSDMPAAWALFSSDPMYSFNNILYVKDNFKFALAKTDAAPYNLTSTLNNYYGKGSIPINMTRCNDNDTITWNSILISQNWWHHAGHKFTYPDPELDLQFDGQCANLTVTGYFDAMPAPTGKNTFNTIDVEVRGQIRISFSGTIDSYHSDELVGDKDKPTWLRTAGFHNATSNADNASKASVIDLPGVWTLAFGLSVAISTYFT